MLKFIHVKFKANTIMDKWSFNMPLFSRLSDVLDITGTEIARRCGLRQQVLSRYTTNEIVVSVQILLKLCNTLRMPVYYFVAEDNNFVIPNRESATIPLDEWQPISWDYDAVERIFGDGKGQIQWKDVAVVMKASSQKPHERFALKRRFKVTDFFVTCNAFNLSPFLFMIDPNRPQSTTSKTQTSTPPSYAELVRKVDHLESDIAELRLKLTALLHDHEALARRVQVNIQNVHNSQIGIEHIGMAAEKRPDEE